MSRHDADSDALLFKCHCQQLLSHSCEKFHNIKDASNVLFMQSWIAKYLSLKNALFSNDPVSKYDDLLIMSKYIFILFMTGLLNLFHPIKLGGHIGLIHHSYSLAVLTSINEENNVKIFL